MQPTDSADLAKRVRDLYSDAEEIILTKLARQVARGITSETWVDRKYRDLQALNASLDKVLADLADDVPGAVEAVMQMAYNRGTAAAVNDLQEVGRAAGAVAAPPVAPSVAVFAEATTEALSQTPFRVRRWTNDVYSRVAAETAGQVLTGVETRREAASSALRKYAARGVTGFVDRSGRNWDLASYAEMATRTQTTQASLEGHTRKLQDLGQGLVVISDASEECKLCRPYEGKVFSIGGGSAQYPPLRSAISGGLFHPNCRHTQSLYIHGITKTPKNTADPKGNKLRERQRAYERRVRQWKRRVILDNEVYGKDSAQAKATRGKLRAAQAEFKQFRDANDRKTLSYRTSLTAR